MTGFWWSVFMACIGAVLGILIGLLVPGPAVASCGLGVAALLAFAAWMES